MNSKKYTNIIRALCIFAAVDLLAGCLLSFAPLIKKNTPDATVIADTKSSYSVDSTRIVNTKEPESFLSLIKTMEKLKFTYPELLSTYTAGFSAGGRELMMYTLGTGAKKALIVGGVHAREHISTKFILACIEDYCKAFYSESGSLGNYNIKELLGEYTLYIIPIVNPDGLEIISSRITPKSGVKVSDINEYKANLNGVDINRNFPLAWDSIDNHVTAPSEYYFKGYETASEPETRALMTLCAENSFEFMLSIHIKGNVLYWGDNYNTALNPAYKAFAEKIAAPCGYYMTEPTEKATDYGGGFENWFRHTFSRPGLCVELGESENIIKATDSTNYKDFDSFVNYGKTVYTFAAAMAN